MLEKFILGLLGSYLMSICLTPLSILTFLEGLKSRFFWCENLEERRMHWVRRYKVLASRDEGGLGIRTLFSFNKAMIF